MLCNAGDFGAESNVNSFTCVFWSIDCSMHCHVLSAAPGCTSGNPLLSQLFFEAKVEVEVEVVVVDVDVVGNVVVAVVVGV